MNNPLYSDRELEHQLNDSGAKVLITHDCLPGDNLAERMIALRPRTGVKQIIYTTVGEYLPPVKKVLFKLFGKMKKLTVSVKEENDVYNFKALMKKEAPQPPEIDIPKVACIFSGNNHTLILAAG